MYFKQFLIALSVALPSIAVTANSMSFDETVHLLSRTGFTPSFKETESFLTLSRVEAVEKILAGAKNPDGVAPGKKITQLPTPPGKDATDQDKKEFRKLNNRNTLSLQQWWLDRMITTTTPFAEQMTLFWHNHFVSSVQKVKAPSLMYKQNALYRDMATGNYQDFVQAMAKEPAMVLYLDSQSNKKSKPNENFARELLELFTLGEGNYSEQDIKEAARAFTGWQINRKAQGFALNKRQHDNGEKTIFGKTGSFSGEEVIDLIFTEKPEQVARHLITKLWLQYISSVPVEAEVNRLAEVFIKNDFELEPLLNALFLSDYFWLEENRYVLIKSPIDLIVGTQRVFSLNITDPSLIRQTGKNLGQMLFAPPNVKGWPGGEDWITSSTFLARTQLLSQVTRAIGGAQGGKNMSMSNDYTNITEYPLVQWQQLLLAESPASYVPVKAEQMTDINRYDREISAMLQDPTYQLK